MRIGGNIKAIIQVAEISQTAMGEDVSIWVDAFPPFYGWLDLSTGDSQSNKYNAKIQESTHIFICDFFEMKYEGIEITPENSRMLIGGKSYEVKIYDNPMNMNKQLEIYLKFVGGQA